MEHVFNVLESLGDSHIGNVPHALFAPANPTANTIPKPPDHNVWVLIASFFILSMCQISSARHLTNHAWRTKPRPNLAANLQNTT